MNSSPQLSEQEIHQQALEWLTRIKSGDCNEIDQQAFERWLTQHPAHLTAYHQVESFWGQLDGLGNIAQTQMHSARRYLNRAQTSRRHMSLMRWAYALTLSSLLILSPLGRHWITSEHYQTLKGERRSIQLGDGSMIELNTDTDLRISYALGQRTVWLEHGEAWFSVTHDAEHPFEVKVANGIIRDVGTQFNVFREAEQVSVTVQEGEVAITSETSQQTQNLSTGKLTVLDRAGQFTAIQTADLDSTLSWRSNLLIFKKQSLQSVLQQLHRYHKVSISLADPKLEALSVSGRFPANDLDQTLNTIANALSVKVVWLNSEQISIQSQH